ncbi:MAG: NUDIX hydrolase, partial [Acidobacteriota bacterium]
MVERFEWLAQQIVYRELRSNHDGEELRWVLTHETIKDIETDIVCKRSLLRHPGVAAIVPITAMDELLLIKQFRYSVKDTLWEIPAGTLQGEWRDGQMVALETAVTAAARELREEAGLVAGRLDFLQKFYTTPGTSDGVVHLFLAFDLSEDKALADIGEVISKIEPFSISRACDMIVRGEICDAKTIIGIYGAKSYLEQR